MESRHRDILAVRFSSLGDLLLTTPLFRAIRTRHPDARITMVVRDDMAVALRHNPHLSELVTWRRGESIRALARHLRATPWTDRLDLHGSLRSVALRRLVGGRWTSYPKHRVRRELIIRTRRRFGGSLAPVAERYFHAARHLDVVPDGRGLEFVVPAERQASADAFLASSGAGAARPVVALAIGAAHFTKRWPLDHWVALAAALEDRADLLVVGGSAETRDGATVAHAAGVHGFNAAGMFPFDGTAALLRRARVVVAGDTGVLHLATAVSTPVVGLYGPTVREFGFFPYHADAEVLEHDLRCRPCSSHGGPSCPLGHHRCLVDLTPARVLEAVTRYLR